MAKKLTIGDVDAIFSQTFGNITTLHVPPTDISRTDISEKDMSKSDISKKDISYNDMSKSDMSKTDTVNGHPKLTRLASRNKKIKPVDPDKDFIPINSMFYKIDNEIDDILIPTLENATAQSLYRLIYRHSYGWGKPVCDSLDVPDMCRLLGGISRTTFNRALDLLISRGYVSITKEATNKSPRHYRVYLPCQIPGLKEKSARNSILTSDMPKIDMSKSDMSHINVTESDILKNNPPTCPNLTYQYIKTDMSDSNPIEETAAPSRENIVYITPKRPPKDNIKDIYKNNNKERLLLFFSNTPFEPVTPEALDWLSQYDYDTVTQYAQEVLAWPGTKNPMALLRAALTNSYKFPKSGRDLAQDSEIKAIIEQQAKQAEAEEQAFKEFKNSLSDEEREKIATRARESLQSDPFYRVIQSEEIKAKYLDGKIEAELRKKFEERRACINPVS
ncbi:MAG: hypothetical protein HPY90_07715 [Syntrophothermus sp.]|uniref:hypothetical protein n=1 Tax=Syntrophothermus sp. TaxID=2736299 RepID=UPI00257DA25C|nr:hypothetical protein [Syntrophothermus sp.]NSW83148.1 hypothetical protein [Syntrophothermus sp.]